MAAAAYPAPFNRPFHLIINLAVGGKWTGNPNMTTPLPATMRVDYVRVYQRVQPDPKSAEAPAE